MSQHPGISDDPVAAARKAYIDAQHAKGQEIDGTQLRLVEMRAENAARIAQERTLGPRKDRLQELCRELLIELGPEPSDWGTRLVPPSSSTAAPFTPTTTSAIA